MTWHLQITLFLILGLFFETISPAAANRPEVTSPQPGEAVQGIAPILGSVNVSGFQRAEVSFSYQQDGEQTWFPIQELTQAVDNDTLALWDTTTIADGYYQVRVQVFLENGEVLQTIVPDLRVRNYSPIETSTPAPLEQAATPTIAPTAISTRPPLPSPTFLPANPAQVTTQRMAYSLMQGALFVIILFLLFGFYLALKKLLRR